MCLEMAWKMCLFSLFFATMQTMQTMQTCIPPGERVVWVRHSRGDNYFYVTKNIFYYFTPYSFI